jgi:hypothetical protein
MTASTALKLNKLTFKKFPETASYHCDVREFLYIDGSENIDR